MAADRLPPLAVTREAALLLDFVHGLNAGYGMERSCKLSAGDICCDRFLLSVGGDALGDTAADFIQGLCAALDFPKALRADLLHWQGAAHILHLGYEGGAASPLVKLYLEFPPSPPSAGVALAVHRAYKWRPRDPQRHALAHYRYRPDMGAAGREALLDRCFRQDREGRAIAAALLERALARLDERELFILEVSEDGQPRHSFDVKLYDAEWRAGDIQDSLARMAAHCGLDDAGAGALIERLGDEIVGHVSAGTGRDGAAFFTVYYGIRACGVET